MRIAQESTFYNVEVDYGVCHASPTESFIRRIRDDFVEDVTYGGSTDCGGGRSDAVITTGNLYHFGTCAINNMLRKDPRASPYKAYILLRNVSDSYTAPQPFVVDKTVPVIGPATFESCPNAEDCKASGEGLYYQHFNDATCTESGSTFEFLNEQEPYKCYLDELETSYVMLSCQGPHTTETASYLDSACTKPRFSTLMGAKCGVTGTSTTQCTGRYVKTPTSTSSASTFQPLAFFYVAIIVIAMFF